MTSLRDETKHTYVPNKLYSGIIVTNAANMLDMVSVTIPGLSDEAVWEDVRWQSKDNITLPQKGDECLVAFDDNGRLWIDSWWASSYVVDTKWIKGVGDKAVWSDIVVNDIRSPVNGQWIKGVGGAAVWSPLASYGTTFPASPLNGDEAVITDSTSAPTYAWKFRYNAGSSSAYKWEFIGGPPKTVYAGLGAWTDMSGQGGGGVWQGLVGISPLFFYVPRSGDYAQVHGAQCGGGVAGDFAQISCGATGGLQGAAVAASQAGGVMWNMTVGGQVNVLQGDYVLAWYYGTSATIMFANRWMHVTPVRCS